MGNLGIATGVIFALYMVVMVIIGIAGQKKTKDIKDYTMAGYSHGGIMAALALFATQCSASSYMGWGGLSYKFGLSTLWNFSAFILMWPLSLMVIGVPMWKWTKAFGSYSFVDAVASRYDSQIAKIVWGLLLFPFIVVMMIAQYKAVGILFQLSTGAPYWLGVIIGGFVVAIYMLIGGKFAELWTNAVQGFMMMVIALMILIPALVMIGGFSGYQSSLVAQDPQLWAAFSKTKFFSLTTAIIFFPFYFCLITPYNMPTIQGCKNILEVKRGVFLTVVAIALGLFVMYLVGSLARGILGGELKVADQAFLKLSIEALPVWLAGFVFAGILAAIMSSVDAMGLMAGTCIGTDFYLNGIIPALGKNPQDSLIQKRALTITKILTFVALIIPIYFAIFNPPTFLTILLFIGLGGTASMFCGPVFAAILFPKRVSKISALVASLAGLVAFLVVLKGFNLLIWYALPIGGAVSFLTSIIVSLFTKPLPEGILEKIAAVS